MESRVRQWLVVIVLVAELLRVGVAVWLVERNRRAGIEHEFADSELYWKLALRIAAREPYNDGRRQVLRTPGYPLFLAGCIALLGPSTTGARHAQAGVAALGCLLLYPLVRKLLGSRAGLISAGMAAVYPFAVMLAAVLLSEALFTVLLLVQLLTLAHLLESLRQRRAGTLWAFAAGLAGAALTLVRPSWILAIPLLVAVSAALGVVRRLRPQREVHCLGQFGVALALAAGFVSGMAPWWVRNWQVTGHVVATTLWVGASLYDGLNEHATGASNMRFLERPQDYGLDAAVGSMSEWDQDQYLRGEAWKFARARPGRVLSLALVKLQRFWSPMPNAEEWRSLPLRLLSLAVCLPVFALAAVGAWRLRRQFEVLLLLAGPVLYFCAIHLVFVSSIRYREAAMLPVLGLVAAALTPRQSPGSESVEPG